MPITTHEDEAERYGGDTDHWLHVMETIHVPAVKAAGFEPIRPVVSGSYLIHGQIIKHLETADMVLCDLSGLNPNVFFELGVRTSLNLPIALVKDEHFSLPFDTSGINTHSYSSALRSWDTLDEIAKLSEYLKASVVSSDGSNPMWRHFGLTIVARTAEPTESSADAQLALVYESVNALRQEVTGLSHRIPVRSPLLRDDHPDALEEPMLMRKTPFGGVNAFAEAAATTLGVGFVGAESLSLNQFRLHFRKRRDSVSLITDYHPRLFELGSIHEVAVGTIFESEQSLAVLVTHLA